MIVSPESVGMNSQGLERVKALFHEQIDRGLHPGAAMAVYRHGRLVLDLYGGMADVESGKPVTEDTLFVIFSSTKPLAAFLLARSLGSGASWRWGTGLAIGGPPFARVARKM